MGNLQDVENPCLANTKQCIRINDKNEPATDNDRNDACPEGMFSESVKRGLV